MIRALDDDVGNKYVPILIGFWTLRTTSLDILPSHAGTKNDIPMNEERLRKVRLDADNLR